MEQSSLAFYNLDAIFLRPHFLTHKGSSPCEQTSTFNHLTSAFIRHKTSYPNQVSGLLTKGSPCEHKPQGTIVIRDGAYVTQAIIIVFQMRQVPVPKCPAIIIVFQMRQVPVPKCPHFIYCGIFGGTSQKSAY